MMRVAYLIPLLAFVCVACEKGMHDMYDQAKFKSYRETQLFADGKTEQQTPPDIQAYSRGTMASTSSGRLGADAVRIENRDKAAESNPYPLTMQLLTRGEERYEIYCSPCHGRVGDGQGLVVEHGFPAPPDFHSERLRKISDRHIFDVISKGYGVMYPYDDRIATSDRWAIVAYVRALQLSRHASVAQLTAQDRKQLEHLR